MSDNDADAVEGFPFDDLPLPPQTAGRGVA
jgi:hypothetical protein